MLSLERVLSVDGMLSIDGMLSVKRLLKGPRRVEGMLPPPEKGGRDQHGRPNCPNSAKCGASRKFEKGTGYEASAPCEAKSFGHD